MKFQFSPIILGCFFLIPSIATPAPKATDSNCERLLRALSADKNGFVTREDWSSFWLNREAPCTGQTQPLVSAPAFDDGTQWAEGRMATFEKLDRDHNGRISPQEWPANERSFRRLDSDNDGSISPEEFLSYNGRFWNELLYDWDSNGDGVLTPNEWLDSEPSFHRVDKDHNGVIDPSEFYARQ